MDGEGITRGREGGAKRTRQQSKGAAGKPELTYGCPRPVVSPRNLLPLIGELRTPFLEYTQETLCARGAQLRSQFRYCWRWCRLRLPSVRFRVRSLDHAFGPLQERLLRRGARVLIPTSVILTVAMWRSLTTRFRRVSKAPLVVRTPLAWKQLFFPPRGRAKTASG